MPSTQPLPDGIGAFALAEMARLEVPGVAAGVWHRGQVFASGWGITNVDHPGPVTPETLFQVGSTSKTFTATALMQLVEEGALDLDSRVQAYVPEFRLQSAEDAERLTVRHLATHHGGFIGDYFKDTGRGDDALAKIVGKMANSPQLIPVGTAFSYSNAGFYVLGHIIATLRGAPFERVIRDAIFEPVGMRTSTYFPEETIVESVVAGHIRTADGPKVARPWNTPRSIAPGGGVISNVVDQLAYAAMHLNGGEAANGRRVLKRSSVENMQTAQARAGSMCADIGISWMLDGEGADRMVKHGGATTGQLSAFEMFPGQDFAVTVLTNGDSGREARQTIADACKRHFIGWTPPEMVPLRPQPALAEYAGVYQAVLARLRVEVSAAGLVVTDDTPERQLADRQHRPLPSEPATLTFVAPDVTAVLDGPRKGERSEFLRTDDGAIAWMRWDGRIARRLQ